MSSTNTSTRKMLDNSNKSDILNLSTRSADFLCQQRPLVGAVEHNRSSGRHRTRAFLLEANMPKGLQGFQKGKDNSAWKGGKINIACANCNKIFQAYKHRKYCSSFCSYLCPEKRQVARNRILGEQGEFARNWKGDNAKYFALHDRVRKQRGNPVYCEICNTSDKDRRYEWANLTGDYGDVLDYKRMCVPCHNEYDMKRKVKQ